MYIAVIGEIVKNTKIRHALDLSHNYKKILAYLTHLPQQLMLYYARCVTKVILNDILTVLRVPVDVLSITLKTIYQSLGIKPDLRPDFNGNDIGYRRGLLRWLLGTFKGVGVKCKK
jgi:hypothetical protein